MRPFIGYLNGLCIVSLLLLGACTYKDKFLGNGEAYSGLKPKDGMYFWIDSRAVCTLNGVTISGYRSMILVKGTDPIRFKKACDDDFTYIPTRDVKQSLFGKEPIDGISLDRVLSYQHGVFDRMENAPTSASTDLFSTRSLFQFTSGSKTYEVIVRAKGSAESPVEARGYVLSTAQNAPEVNVSVVASSDSNDTRSYQANNFDLKIKSTGAQTSLATFKTTVENATLDVTTNEGSDTFVTPPPPAESETRIELTAGLGFSCGSRNGAMSCWGYNSKGQLGNGSTSDSNSPVGLPLMANGVSQMSAMGPLACAIQNNTAKCWGTNSSGQLGRGNSTPFEPSPANVALANPTSVSVGNVHACAVAARKAYCWGDNSGGQLGTGDTANHQSPVLVNGIPGDIVAVSSGYLHACALNSLGEVYCWGNNGSAQLGNGTTGGQSYTPSKVLGSYKFVTITSYQYLNCGITDAGRVACWGNNNASVLSGTGQNTPSNFNTPNLISGLAGPVTSLSVGETHACAIQQGVVYCWGDNTAGGTGLGITIGYSPVTAVSGAAGETAVSVACGQRQTLLRTQNSVKAWGDNFYGQLGYGSAAQYSAVPVTVSPF